MISLNENNIEHSEEQTNKSPSFIINSEEEDIKDTPENYLFTNKGINQNCINNNSLGNLNLNENAGNISLINDQGIQVDPSISHVEHKNNSLEIVKDIITTLLENSMELSESLKEQKKKDEEEKAYLSSMTYMQRKLYLYEKEMKKQFCPLSGMKKTYSHIEQEKLKLKEREKENNENINEGKIIKNININLFKNNEDLNSTKDEINKNILEVNNQNIFIGKKRIFDDSTQNKENNKNQNNNNLIENYHSGYTPIKKIKKNYIPEGFEDFNTLMSKAKKIKPLIQIQKEKFLEEQNKRKLNELENSKNILKSQVLKCDL